MGSFSASHWIIFGLIVFVLFKLVKPSKSSESMVCKACGTVGRSSMAVRGSFAIEVVLWLCFIVPGLIYSLWRLSTRHAQCEKCGSLEVIPADTPLGQSIAKQHAKEVE